MPQPPFLSSSGMNAFVVRREGEAPPLRVVLCDFILFVLDARMIGHLQNGGCWPPHGNLTPTEDLSEPPSLAATVLSRSACDWTEVSLSLLPVIALPCGATAQRCTLREVLAFAIACRCKPAALPGNSRNVFCKGLFSFQGTFTSGRLSHRGCAIFKGRFMPLFGAFGSSKSFRGKTSPSPTPR